MLTAKQQAALYWARRRRLQLLSGPFSPLDLFKNGELGGFYDFSDRSSLFQDSAGTIPVTADSQPVGMIKDKSGRGNHLLQATAASRPLYKTDGTYSWLEGDGVDDWLQGLFTIAQPYDRLCALRQISWTLNERIIAGGVSPLGILYQTSPASSMAIYNGGSIDLPSFLPIGTDGVITESYNGTSSRIALNNNAYGTYDAGPGVPGGLTLFADGDHASLYGNARIYNIIIRQGTMTDKQITDTRNWLAAKAGINFTIPDEPETTALLARMTVQPDATRKTVINTLIKSLKDNGIWNVLDVLYILASHDAQAAQMNWKAATFPLTPMLTPTFTVDRGYDFNGTTQYLRTGFVPSTNGVQFKVNDASAFIWCRENIAGGSGVISLGAQGASSVRQMKINPRHTSGQYFYSLNADANVQHGTVTDSTGLTHINRVVSTTVEVYKNGISGGTATSTSSNVPAVEVDIGALNANGTITGFDSKQIAAVGLGGSLDATKALALYNALQAYMTAVGA